MAVYANLTVDQGASFSANIDVVDNDGDALNINGYTVAGQLRKTYSSTTATDFTTSIINASAGVAQISLTATQTGALKAGRYVYDVEINNSGTITRVIEGQIEVTPGVTRD